MVQMVCSRGLVCLSCATLWGVAMVSEGLNFSYNNYSYIVKDKEVNERQHP